MIHSDTNLESTRTEISTGGAPEGAHSRRKEQLSELSGGPTVSASPRDVCPLQHEVLDRGCPSEGQQLLCVVPIPN